VDGINVSELVPVLTGKCLCTYCIGFKFDARRGQVDVALEQVGGLMRLVTTVARCDACLKETVVHRLG
jgi:hypothetical protein